MSPSFGMAGCPPSSAGLLRPRCVRRKRAVDGHRLAGRLLLEAPGLQSTPQLGQAVFAYQDQVKQAREAAKAAAPAEATPQQAPADQKPALRRNLSLNAAATEIAGQMAESKPADNAAKPEAMQPNMAAPPKPAPQPLNVI